MWEDEMVVQGQQSGIQNSEPDGVIRHPGQFAAAGGQGPSENSLSSLIDVCQESQPENSK